ncbi:MAG: glycosyltransferase family 9 protein [Verrucomicrobiota bacterium]
MRKLILKTKFSLGDVVMMTAAVRDLHRRYPGEFITDVRTHFPEVWENNPHISYLEERDPQVQVLDCRYPLINYANERPYHCLHGYIDFLNQQLGLNIVPTEFKGDIHLSKEEKAWGSQVEELSRLEIPFWIVAAGGKFDITIKWWETARYQRVIDHFRNRIVFAQIGELGHHHPKLKHTIDLRGQTSVRELIRLVYHAQGCLCGVTALMHLAAAVEPKLGQNRRRACVIVAGAREPAHWEAYPQHAFLHTVGAVPCATQGGCWKSRVVPLRDGDSRDKPGNLCENVSNGLPRCMELITAEDVIKGIGCYFEGGTLSYFTVRAGRGRVAVRASQVNTKTSARSAQPLPYRMMAETGRVAWISRRPSRAGNHHLRRRLSLLSCAWVCVHMLREVGCQLPVQLWHEGAAEMDERMIRLMERLGVECVDASQFQSRHPRRMGGGWELKSYAILHSRFEEVLFLDADNVPVRDPTYLFV